MAGVVIGGATVALTSVSDIKVIGVVYFGSTVNYAGGLAIVTPTTTVFTPSLNFSIATNSMYVPLVFG
jgi:hypothetical protein